jgi:hypothetical protein
MSICHFQLAELEILSLSCSWFRSGLIAPSEHLTQNTEYDDPFFGQQESQNLSE